MLRSSLNYFRRSSYRAVYPNHSDVVSIDTSIETAMKNSNSDVDTSVKGEYLNNDIPVEIYGNSLLMTEYDPILSKRVSAAKAASQAQHAQSDSSVNTVQNNVSSAEASQAAAQNLN